MQGDEDMNKEEAEKIILKIHEDICRIEQGLSRRFSCLEDLVSSKNFPVLSYHYSSTGKYLGARVNVTRAGEEEYYVVLDTYTVTFSVYNRVDRSQIPVHEEYASMHLSDVIDAYHSDRLFACVAA